MLIIIIDACYVNTEHFSCLVTANQILQYVLIIIMYACYVNTEHFLCPVTANKKPFRQESEEEEAEAEAGEDASSRMTTIRRLLLKQSP